MPSATISESAEMVAVGFAPTVGSWPRARNSLTEWRLSSRFAGCSSGQRSPVAPAPTYHRRCAARRRAVAAGKRWSSTNFVGIVPYFLILRKEIRNSWPDYALIREKHWQFELGSDEHYERVWLEDRADPTTKNGASRASRRSSDA
jgi:hypothetical protein